MKFNTRQCYGRVPYIILRNPWFGVAPRILRDHLILYYSRSLPWGCHQACQLVSLFVGEGTSLAARKRSVTWIICAIKHHPMVTSSDNHKLLTLESCTWNWKYRHRFANPLRHLIVGCMEMYFKKDAWSMNLSAWERQFSNIWYWILHIPFCGYDEYNIWYCNRYAIQFMISYYHIYACFWVRKDLFLLWDLVANRWIEVQCLGFFLSIKECSLFFSYEIWKSVVKEGMRRWKKTVTLVCFILLNSKHQVLEGTHFTKKKIY